ncbi:hypothetical protein ACFLIM_23500 [Nonomuraea sp. M3C6]|uniref:Uncharacterized protein n=1 Tax=Nonomuraea marmarensis TaxID=3351344 RepID=A0ABW7AJ34_9ACTN
MAIYQVCVRGFAGGDGDRVGDLIGVRDRLAYLAEPGVDVPGAAASAAWWKVQCVA